MGLFASFKRKLDIYDETENDVSSEPIPRQTEKDTAARRENAEARNTADKAVLRLQVFRPSEFGDAPAAAECLKCGKAAVIDLDGMEEGGARRLIDYLAGVLYALDGRIERLAPRKFLLVPDGVSVSSEDMERLGAQI